ncbi:MAG: PP2C family protein-serine/threonine phosphatase [Candidatus Eiseniibacteriota bacterium]
MPGPAERVTMTTPVSGSPTPTPVRLRPQIGALTDRGKVRETNEDAFIVFRIGRFLERVMSNIPESELPSHTEDSGYLMVVADGLGGHEAGDVASRSALVSALQLILRSPRWALKLDDPATREREISDLLGRTRGYLAGIHAILRRKASEDVRLAGMGTTMTGAFFVGSDLFVLHVGDSKAYLLRDGELRKITHDHTVAQQYADLGVIPQEDVPGHRMQHVLTRAVGGPDEDLEGDIYHLMLREGDRVLLCSDGLTDMANEAEIARILAASPNCDESCRALVDLALSRGGRDNITTILARFDLA